LTNAGLGVSLALIGSVSFGAYILPRKVSKLTVVEYQYWLGITIVLVGLVVLVIAGSPLLAPSSQMLPAFICGPLWTIGSLCYSSAVDQIGVTRSTPVKNLAPVFAALYGIALFSEYTFAEPVPMAMAISGVLLMLLAAVMIARAGAHESEKAFAFDVSRTAGQRKRSMKLGIAYSFGAAFFYGSYSVPLKNVFRSGGDAYTAFAWLAVGVFVSSIAIFVVRERRLLPKKTPLRELAIAQAAGTIWSSGQLLGSLAMLYIPMSISWPISNISTLLAVVWGVVVFREVHLERHLKDVVAATALYACGLVLLVLAAPQGHV
jgi:drug/metabolite transporter (DMT)-like permease